MKNSNHLLSLNLLPNKSKQKLVSNMVWVSLFWSPLNLSVVQKISGIVVTLIKRPQPRRIVDLKNAWIWIININQFFVNEATNFLFLTHYNYYSWAIFIEIYLELSNHLCLEIFKIILLNRSSSHHHPIQIIDNKLVIT